MRWTRRTLVLGCVAALGCSGDPVTIEAEEPARQTTRPVLWPPSTRVPTTMDGTEGDGGMSAMATAPPSGASSTGQSMRDEDEAAGEAKPSAAPKPLPSLIGDVTLSVPSQTFVGTLEVSLSTMLNGAEIRYTTDGTLPTAESELFDGNAVVLEDTTQLRAQAFADGMAVGGPSTGLYIVRDFEFTSNLPIMIVHGYGEGKPNDKDVYLDAAVMLFEPTNGTASVAELPTIATRAGYHIRGQSSSRFPKAPYRLELWDNSDEDSDYPLLGMPAQSDWALISPYYDRTIIRNPFVYTLGREIGLDAPRTEYVEVFLNYDGITLREDDYQGIYWLSETIKNAKDRLDLAQLNESDTAPELLSGGYIVKFDQAAAEDPELDCTGAAPLPSFGFGGQGFGGQNTGQPIEVGTCWVDLEVVDPVPLAPEQAAWITNYIQEFHDTLHEEPIGDYAKYIDVDSFVDNLIVNEFTRNVDAYVRSAYYHKDREGKLRAGPLWDYNFSLALGGQNSGDPLGRFQYEGSRNVNNWYQRLTTDPSFMAQVAARWTALRQDVLSDAAILERMERLSAPLTEAIEREYEKWPVERVYSNSGIVRGIPGSTWEEQLATMREFAIARAAHLDTQFR